MKKIAICLLFLVCGFPGVALAGLNWNDMDAESKAWMITGYLYGQNFLCISMDSPKELKSSKVCEQVNNYYFKEDLRPTYDLLNNIYLQEKYFDIPVGFILHLAIAVQTGDLSEQDFYERIDDFITHYKNLK